MFRSPLARLAAPAPLVLFAACADPTGVPVAQRDVQPSAASTFHPPPPPPIDTQSVAYDENAGAGTLTYLETTYLHNRPGTNTWIAFDGEGASPNARLQLQAKGDGSVKGVKGQGTVVIGGEAVSLKGATLVRSSLGPCTAAPEDGETAPRIPSGACGGISVRVGGTTYRFEVGVPAPRPPVDVVE